MDFKLSEDQEWRVEAVQRAVREQIDPLLRRHPVDEALPKGTLLEIYALLAPLGLIAPRLPMLDYGLMLEQLPAAIALSVLAHGSTVAGIEASCSPELRERYLPDLVAGRRIAATAHGEAEAGGDASLVDTRLQPDGDHLRLNGRKRGVANALVADLLHVSCLRSGDGEHVRFALVEREQAGLSAQPLEAGGLRQGHLGDVSFDDCLLPAGNVGDDDDALRTMSGLWSANRPLVGLICVRLAQQAFEMALDHCREQRLFGKPLSAHQLVQQDLAEIETQIVSARLLCCHALDGLDHGLRSIGSAAMAKRHAAQACERAIRLALQLHGGSAVEQLWRDVRTLQASAGLNGMDSVLSLVQGRELTGLSAFR